MYISPINYQIQNKQTTFGTNNISVFADTCKKQLKYKNTTEFFRACLDWNEFAKFLKYHFLNDQKINVYCFGCSDGSEPYSLSMVLREKLGDDSRKFFPIIAKDVDPKIIATAQSGLIDYSSEDKMFIDYFTNQKFEKYFTFEKYLDQNIFSKDYMAKAHVNSTLRKTVSFSQGDILKEVNSIPKENTVVLCRNFWRYLSPQDREYLAKNLYKRLDNKSCVITGYNDDYNEQKFSVTRELQSAGFKKLVNYYTNIFIKE